MKVIFLDIDGVLAPEANSRLEQHPEFSYPFDMECVNVLNDVIRTTEAEIVLTSDWRVNFENNLSELNRLFKYNSLIKGPIDVTPDFSKNRNKEIASYVNKNKAKIDSFVIIDDMPLTVHSLRFVNTKLEIGIKEECIKQQIIEKLTMNQTTIDTCINCGSEFFIKDDNYCCSDLCRIEIDNMKMEDATGITDSEIKEYALYNLVVSF